MPPPTFLSRRRPRRGVVEQFDDERGLGVVAEDGGRLLPFHATAVADGSRTVAVGTVVMFEAVPGHGGRLEARGLVPFG